MTTDSSAFALKQDATLGCKDTRLSGRGKSVPVRLGCGREDAAGSCVPKLAR